MEGSKQLGNFYEALAADFLTQQGFLVLERNYFCKQSEIDLIVQNSDVLVFVEVKYRQNPAHGHPAAYVTPKKQAALYRCAQFYLLEKAVNPNQAMRFDVVAFDGSEQPIWLQNAFGGW